MRMVCAYLGTDLVGTSHAQYPPDVVPIRVMCSGRVDPAFVLRALANGADGVPTPGCDPGDSGNYRAMARYALPLEMLDQFGIDKERVRGSG